MRKPNIIKKSKTLSLLIDKIHYFPRNALAVINPKALSKIVYKRRTGKKLHLNPPVLFNEKLMWLKLNYYNNNPLVTECADKYRARDYVERCGLGNTLNEMIGAWDSTKDIPWETLPNQFAIKCNHGCGYNIICDDKETLDTASASARLEKWMKTDFWKEAAELNYKNIKHKIICEKYIGNEQKVLPSDFKVYCFNGVPKFIGYYHDRIKETHILKRGYYDFDWKPVDFMSNQYKTADTNNNDMKKPPFLDEIYEISKKLSEPFPFVRVDLYEVDGKIIFGELTFTPAFCTGTMFTDDGMLELGNLITLPQI